MNKNLTIGIDVSKDSLDILVKSDKSSEDYKIKNIGAAIRKFFKPYAKNNAIIAMENTGRYNWALYDVLSGFSFTVFVIPPLHLSKSMGLARGKNDKIDAKRIVDFISRHHDQIPVWKQPSDTVRKLKVLLAERRLRVDMKRRLASVKKDYKLMKGMGLDVKLRKLNEEEKKNLNKQIEVIESNINELIKSDPDLYEKAKLAMSVPGVGKVLCWHLLARTEGFSIIDNPRKLACYAGVVPFDHQSGTSVFKKPKVSFYADKTLKSLLHLGAMSAIQCKNDLREYYNRKVSEGKNKMAVLNAVRNKIIHRVYAVIKNKKPYENFLVVS